MLEPLFKFDANVFPRTAGGGKKEFKVFHNTFLFEIYVKKFVQTSNLLKKHEFIIILSYTAETFPFTQSPRLYFKISRPV